MKKLSLSLLIIVGALCSCEESTTSIEAYQYNSHKSIEVDHAAVVTAHPLASEVGLQILKAGGNAVDAAIATNLALAVVYPRAGNIGGGGFAVIHLKDGRDLTVDFREVAPGKSFRDMYLDSLGDADLHLSQNGHLAAGVPGSIAGMFKMAPYGKLPFEELIQPAIDLAKNGFAITESEANLLNRYQNDFKKYNSVTPVFVKGQKWKVGDTLVQKDLAETLTRVREQGKKGFYEGKTAELIVDEMKRGGGIITREDLKKYEAVERTPISFDYKGAQIVTMPLPSSGGIILEQLLKMSALYKLDTMGFETAESVNLMTEIERRGFADRAKYMGDPDFYDVPVKELVSENYLKKRMEDFVPGKAGNSEEIKEGIIPESMETTHFNVLDEEGNAVAITTTINGNYGSRTVVGHAGFLLNNEMDDFSVKPGVPNMFGAVGQEANAVEPYKKMLSSMSPTIVLKEGKPWIILGTPGGTTIITSVYQTIVDLLDFGMSPGDAVNKPKFHHQWLPDVINLEKGFDEQVKSELEEMGYTIEWSESIGRTEVIMVDEHKKIIAIADHRGDDSAVGY